LNSSEARRKLGNYGLTPFEIDVLLATLAIPKGRTATYKQIAERIGHKNAYRAVGSALKKNPLAPIIPCHRVIKSDGSIGNYSGGGSKKKLMMLQKEGAII
jgi:O-6-methylguanine DNA methyltransferase